LRLPPYLTSLAAPAAVSPTAGQRGNAAATAAALVMMT